MIHAVKRLTGLPINHMMVIKFDGLPEDGGRSGGRDRDQPDRDRQLPLRGGADRELPGGPDPADGPQALVFSRVRKCDTDFNRALRQQAVVAGMKSKVLSFSNLWRAPWRGAQVVRTLRPTSAPWTW